jgi:hypothetical protein
MGYTLEMPKAMYQDASIKEYYVGILENLKEEEQSGIIINSQMSFYKNDLDINIIVIKESE